MTMVGMKLFSRAAVRESSGRESEWRERHCHEQMMRTVWRASSTADSLERQQLRREMMTVAPPSHRMESRHDSECDFRM